MYRYEDVLKSSLEYFNGDELAATTWIKKYCLRDLEGNLLEKSPEDMHNRIADEILRIEERYSVKHLTKEKLMELLEHFKYLVPGGSQMSGIGDKFKHTSLSNCFVIGNGADSYGGIMMLDEELIQIAKRRGGDGIDLSHLRPSGAIVTNDARSSSGAASFMSRFSNSSQEVAQNGRRGALMLTIDITHPDSEAFIDAKLEQGKISGANISVRISREFMKAVKDNQIFIQRFPCDTDKLKLYDVGDSPSDPFYTCKGEKIEKGKLYDCGNGRYLRVIEARDLWNKITHNAWKMAEPGVLFWDHILEESPADVYEDFRTISTNPCLVGSTSVEMSDGTYKCIKDIVPSDKVRSINSIGQEEVSEVVWSGLTKKNADIYKIGNLEGTSDHKVFDIKKGDYVNLSEVSIIRTSYKRNINPLEDIEKLVPRKLGEYYTEDGLEKRYIELFGKKYEGWVWDIQKVLFDNDPDIQKINQFINYCFSNGYGRKSIAKLLGLTSTTVLLTYCHAYGLKDRVDSLDKLYETRSSYNLSKNYLSSKGLEVAKELGICVKNNNIPTQGIFNIIKFNDKFYYSRSIPELKFLVYNLYEGEENIEIEPEFKGHKVDFKIGDKYYEIKDWFGLNRPRKIYDQEDDGSVIWLENITDYDCDLPFTLEQIRNYLVLDFDTETAYNAEVVRPEVTNKKENVYDIKLNKNHNFFANEILVHNCGEIPLCPYDSCRLLSINLYGIVDNPFTENATIDYDKLRNVAKSAQTFMDDVLDLEIEHIKDIINKIKSDPESDSVKQTELNLWNKILYKTKRGRRTGIGVTGIGDMLAAIGLRYGSGDANNVMTEVMRTVAMACYQQSITLAKERGAFDAFDLEKEKKVLFGESIPEYGKFLVRIFNQLEEQYQRDWLTTGRRNIACLTCAPSGTISIMTQTTSGIEPLFMVSYTRRRKVDDKSKATYFDVEGVGFEEFRVVHPKFIDWFSVAIKSDDKVKELFMSFTPREVDKDILTGRKPVNGPKSIIDKLTNEEFEQLVRLSPWYNATAQTINPSTKVVLQAGVQKWIDHSISCTVNLPKETREETVRELYELAYQAGCKGLTVYRDGCRDGVLVSNKKEEKKNTDFSNSKRPEELPAQVYRFKNQKENWIAFIGFREGRPYEIFTGKIDGEVKWLPKPVTKGIIKQITDENGKHRYDFLYEVEFGYTNCFPAISQQFEREYWNYARFVSGMLRAGIPLPQIVSVLKGLSAESLISVWKEGVARALSQFIEDGTKTGAQCPNCGADLIFEGGCTHCPNGDFDRCG